jgi:hypothetical protein
MEQRLLRCRKIPFYTGTLSLDPRGSESFPLKTRFLYAKVPFKTDLYVYCYRALAELYRQKEPEILRQKRELWHFVHHKSPKKLA